MDREPEAIGGETPTAGRADPGRAAGDESDGLLAHRSILPPREFSEESG